MKNCECSFNCSTIGIIISLVLGAIAGVAFFLGSFTVSTIAIAAVLAVGLTFLLATFIVSLIEKNSVGCICIGRKTYLLLAAILGTIVLSLLALIAGLTAATALSSVIVGLWIFFTALIVTTVSCIIICTAAYDCR